MIPLTLITGFLGSGKTTLLRYLIEQARGRRLVCVVNEFGPLDIDGQLLELPPEQLVSIPGGSIFCRCLAGEFIRVLNLVAAGQPQQQTQTATCACDPSVAASEPPEGVLVEASGIADPKVIRQMLRETRLDEVFDLRRIMAVVDPGSFLKLIHTLPNIIAQIEACDLAILNKADLYGPEQIQQTQDAVREINPAAAIVHAQYCRAEFDIFAVPIRSELCGQYAACADPHYITRTVSLSRPVDLQPLLAELRRIQPDVYRIKGFVPTAEGRMYVDVSASGVICRPAAHRQGGCELVLIAGPHQRTEVDRFAAALQGQTGFSLPILA